MGEIALDKHSNASVQWDGFDEKLRWSVSAPADTR